MLRHQRDAESGNELEEIMRVLAPEWFPSPRTGPPAPRVQDDHIERAPRGIDHPLAFWRNRTATRLSIAWVNERLLEARAVPRALISILPAGLSASCSGARLVYSPRLLAGASRLGPGG